MAKKILNRKKLNPSIPVFTGTKQIEEISVQLFQYNHKEYSEDLEYDTKKLVAIPNLDSDCFCGDDDLP